MASIELNFLPADQDKPLLVFFQDEGRFGRINSVYRCWVPKAERAIVGKQIVREYVYAYTAVCPENGDTFSLVITDVCTESMNVFLQEFSKYYTDYRIIMIMDKAGWHRSKSLIIPENIQLLLLPAYSPELNPAEHIWDYIREKFFHNRIFDSIECVIDSLCNALNHLNCYKGKVKSMTLFNWLF